MTFHIYLAFDGQCEAAFKFYQSVFDATLSEIKYFKDIPSDCKLDNDPHFMNKIMHIALPITNEFTLLGCDAAGPMKDSYQKGTNFSISLNVENKSKAEDIFGKLSENGQVSSPMSETFWGSHFGMLTDQFGIQWMISAPK
jgi:PhnB protein